MRIVGSVLICFFGLVLCLLGISGVYAGAIGLKLSPRSDIVEAKPRFVGNILPENIPIFDESAVPELYRALRERERRWGLGRLNRQRNFLAINPLLIRSDQLGSLKFSFKDRILVKRSFWQFLTDRFVPDNHNAGWGSSPILEPQFPRVNVRNVFMQSCHYPSSFGVDKGNGALISSFGGTAGFQRLPSDDDKCDYSDDYKHPLGGCIPLWRLTCGSFFWLGTLIVIYHSRHPKWLLLGNLLLASAGTLIWATGKVPCNGGHYCNEEHGTFHAGNTVTHKDWPSSVVSVIPSFAKVKNRARWRRKLSDVMKAKIGGPGLLESVSIFNPPVQVDRSYASSNVSYFRRGEGTVKPQQFVESTAGTERIREHLRYSRRNRKHYILLCYRNDRDPRPAHHFICRSLPRVFYKHTNTRNIGFGWLWRSQHCAVKNASVFWQYISLQLPLSAFAHMVQRSYSNDESANGCNEEADGREVLRRKQTREVAWRLCGMAIILPLGCLLIYYCDYPSSRATRLLCAGGGSIFIAAAFGLGFFPIYNQSCKDEHQYGGFHGQIVSQKDLTWLPLCNTVSGMANVLSKDKQIAVIGALAEGSSLRSIERISGVHRDTIMRLGVRVGQGCATLLDGKMRDLSCRYLQFDEVWGFIGKKERHLRADDDPSYGDVWTFCAIDADTKLVPSFRCGKRDLKTATAFVADVASRIPGRVQISSDALRAYQDAIEQVYGTEVDFAQIVKTYEHDHSQHPEHKYSAPKFVAVDKRAVMGNPDMDLVSTSYIERLNATTRLHMRRLTRLTLAFSKKLENFEAAVALHFAYYNLVKRHGTLRCTPAMAAGVERDFWSVGDLVEAAL